MNAFSLLVGISAALGLAWTVWRMPNAPQPVVERLLRSELWVMFGAMVGARIAYLLPNLPYYIDHPTAMIAFWEGGLSWTGALPGTVLTVILVGRKMQKGIPRLADALLPAALLVCMGIWLGCWQSGVAYGIQLSAGSGWGLPSIDETGRYALRIPLQLIGAVLTLLCFTIIEQSKAPFLRASGHRGLAALISITALLLALSFFRADPAPQWMGLRWESWLGMVYLLAEMGLVVRLSISPHRLQNATREPDPAVRT